MDAIIVIFISQVIDFSIYGAGGWEFLSECLNSSAGASDGRNLFFTQLSGLTHPTMEKSVN